MILEHAHFMRRGSQADLFDVGDGRVYKLFRRGKDELHTRAAQLAFEAECRAFEIASAVAELAPHIATLHGVQSVEHVKGAQGQLLDERYLLQCCYATEKLTGEELSPFAVPEEREAEVMQLLRRFEEAGVNYAEDGSVFGWEPGGTIRFIDIATNDIRAWLPDD